MSHRYLRLVTTGTVALAAMAPALAAADDARLGAITAGAGSSEPHLAGARSVVVPGNLTGLGFDACAAPDQSTMDTLRVDSPYWSVGVYIGGEERTCPQDNLTPAWVRTQAARGWRIMPIWAGRQSACSDVPFDYEIAPRNARAEQQGRDAANDAVRAATGLGIARGSTLFLDVEAYKNTTSACNQPVLHFQSGWSARLHAVGWKSGFYAAGSSGIRSLDYVRATFPGYYEMPDAIWISAANGKPTTDGKPYVRDNFWARQRLHQYAIDVTETHAGTTLTLDGNAVEIGKGSVAPRPGNNCHGERLSFASYTTLRRGAKGSQVTAAQCLLKQRGLYGKDLSTSFGASTGKAVRAFQRRVGLAVTGAVTASTWTALLSGGTMPLVKRGSASDRVRFLQRSLTAALDRPVEATGIFSAATTSAVTAYQRAVGVDANGVVQRDTWRALRRGDR